MQFVAKALDEGPELAEPYQSYLARVFANWYYANEFSISMA